jgi:hypothetical protein
LGGHALRWYCGVVTDDLEFWTMKAGPDALTRISVRASGQGRRESWMIASDEAERDILRLWAAIHCGDLPGPAGPQSVRRAC